MLQTYIIKVSMATRFTCVLKPVKNKSNDQTKKQQQQQQQQQQKCHKPFIMLRCLL